MAARKLKVGLGMLFLAAVSSCFFLHPKIAASQTGDPASLLRHVEALLADSFHNEAMTILDQVSSQNPGTSYDAKARLIKAYELAGERNFSDSKVAYRSVVRDFPGRPEAFVAGLNLADFYFLDEGGSLSNYIAELDRLATLAGGTSVSRLMAGSGSLQIRPVKKLTDLEQRAVLAELYSLAGARLSRLETSQTTMSHRLEGLRLKLSIQNALPDMVGRDLSESIREDSLVLAGMDLNTGFGQDRVPPRVVKLRARLDGRGHFQFVSLVHDGDVSEMQIDRNSVEYRLDGTSVDGPYDFTQRTQTPPFKAAKPYERTRIVYSRPSGAVLAAGKHILELRVSDRAGNITTRNVTFFSPGLETELESGIKEDDDWDWE